MDTTGAFVDIVFVQDIDSERDEMGTTVPDRGDRDALAEYLAQWDYGTETDDAHTGTADGWGPYDTLSEHTVGGLTYVLGTHPFGYAYLARRPLS